MSGLVVVLLVDVGLRACYEKPGTDTAACYYQAAVAVGTMLGAACYLPPRLYGYDRPIECWLAISDNLIGPDAYRPDDVVTACDGTSIEVRGSGSTIPHAGTRVDW
eukprot:2250928-Rhodomonas_salina.1